MHGGARGEGLSLLAMVGEWLLEQRYAHGFGALGKEREVPNE